jgi:hypothetical protein
MLCALLEGEHIFPLEPLQLSSLSPCHQGDTLVEYQQGT